MAGKLATIMDGLAARVTAAALVPNVYAYPAESVTVPCAVVGYPTQFDFDMTFGRGADEMVFPVWLVAGKAGQAVTRDALSALIEGSTTFKTTLDGSSAFGDIRVTGVTIEEMTIARIAYLGARFDCEVYG